MPTYVYHCDICGTDFEATQRFSDEPLRICPQGHEAVRRVFTPAGIIFKGSGWYIKDSKGSSTPPSTPSATEGKKAKSKSEATPAADDAGKSASATPSTETAPAT